MTPRDRPLIAGTVDLMVLRALAEGPRHGFDVTRTVHARTDGEVEIRDAALYQALHRLEEQGFLSSEWGRSENGRRARFYQLTRPGRGYLEREGRAFREQAEAVLRMLAPEQDAGS